MTAPLQITLFGPIQVRVEGQFFPKLRSRKALWLLALLALREGAPTTRERLAFALWPDSETGSALANLRVVVSELRQALDNQGERLIVPNRSQLALDIRDVTIDALEFDQAFKNRDFARMAGLYQGELLEGCAEEWAVQERRVRQEQALTALQTLGDQDMQVGNYVEAFDWYQRALTLNPLRDEPLRGVMRALVAKGDTNGALQAYREFANLLRRDMGGIPDEQTAQLYARLRKKSRQTHEQRPPAPPRDAPVIGSVPHPLSPLIGREDEGNEVVSKLRLNRLISLTGVGGIGKTRLAIEVASEVRPIFPDGVWFVPLEALSEGTQVVQAIISALDFRVETNTSPLEALIKGLRSKRILLVLDNCEHLLEACAEVCETLLRTCGELRLLVTSREALGISGESIYRVPGLSIPAPESLPQHGATRTRVALSYESVALFVERAQSVASDFLLDADNAASVASICARLEGIPLAIELAAVQASAMSVVSIAGRLEDMLRPFVAGHRAPHPRQQTVRATLDWSYELLNPDERRVLARLSVFVGGWTLEAAESVIADEALVSEAIERARVASLLRSLVDKSLVVFQPRQDRYRLLEPVRQYAAEHLFSSGEKHAVQASHQAWFLHFAEQAEVGLEGADQGLWTQNISVEEENLGAAMDETEVGLKIAGAISRFWYIRGEFEKGLGRLQHALAECLEPTVARRKACYMTSALLHCQGKYDEARLYCLEALSIAEHIEDRRGAALALNSLAMIARQLNDHDQERIYRAQSLLIFRELGDRRGIVGAIMNDAHGLLHRGDYRHARPILQEALPLISEIGNLTTICVIHLQLGVVECFMGNYEAAQTHYETCRELQESLGSKRGVAMALQGLGNIKNVLGHTEAAQNFYLQALDLFRGVGDRPGEAETLCGLVDLENQELHLASAKVLMQESMDLIRELDKKFSKVSLAESMRINATLARLSNDIVSAQSSICKCLRLIHLNEFPQLAVEALEELGAIYLKMSQPHQAARVWEVVEALRQLMGSPEHPSCQGNLKRWRQETAVLLGEDEFARITAEGATLGWREAVRQFADDTLVAGYSSG